MSGDHVWGRRDLVDDEDRPCHLRRTATSALQHHDRTVFDQLAAPHTGNLAALEGAAEARLAQAALRADRLGSFDV